MLNFNNLLSYTINTSGGFTNLLPTPIDYSEKNNKNMDHSKMQPMYQPTSLTGVAVSLLKPSGYDNLMDTIGFGSLLGQTSLDTISSEGGQIVSNAISLFEREVSNNPSKALTDLSETLHYNNCRYDLMILNASSNRTKNGLPISKTAIVNAINTFLPNAEAKLSRLFEIKKQPKTSSFTFKITKEYTSNVYTLTPKTSNSSKVGNNLIDKPLTKKSLSIWLKPFLILLLPFGLLSYAIIKLLKNK